MQTFLKRYDKLVSGKYFWPISFTVIAIIALGFRLWLAPSKGFGSDLGLNMAWARSAAELGLGRSYHEQINGAALPNYPPLSIFAFGAIGLLVNAFDLVDHTTAFRVLIKMPGIFADIVTLILLMTVVARARNARTGALAGLLYAINPPVFYNSAVWGQTDSLYTVFIVAGLFALLHKHMAWAGALGAWAFLTKAQAAPILLLFPFLIWNKPKDLLTMALGIILGIAAVLLPFAPGNGVPGIIKVYRESVGFYTSVCMGAYNFWWALMADSAGSTQDTTELPWGVTYRTMGFMLFGLSALYVLCCGALSVRLKQRSKRDLAYALHLAGLLAFGFYLLNTQMHERYMFPFVALSFPWAVISGWRFAALYIAASLLFWGNLLGILPWTFIDRTLFSTFPTFDAFIGSGLTFIFLAMLPSAWPRLRSAKG